MPSKNHARKMTKLIGDDSFWVYLDFLRTLTCIILKRQKPVKLNVFHHNLPSYFVRQTSCVCEKTWSSSRLKLASNLTLTTFFKNLR